MATAKLFKEWKQMKNSKYFEDIPDEKICKIKTGAWYKTRAFDESGGYGNDYVFYLPEYSVYQFYDSISGNFDINGANYREYFVRNLPLYASTGTIVKYEEAIRKNWKIVIDSAINELKSNTFCPQDMTLQGRCNMYSIYSSKDFKQVLNELFPKETVKEIYTQLKKMDKSEWLDLIQDLFGNLKYSNVTSEGKKDKDVVDRREDHKMDYEYTNVDNTMGSKSISQLNKMLKSAITNIDFKKSSNIAIDIERQGQVPDTESIELAVDLLKKQDCRGTLDRNPDCYNLRLIIDVLITSGVHVPDHILDYFEDNGLSKFLKK